MTDNATYDLWEAVIGLELHVQLNTKSKLFSPALNKFGDEPNVNISNICTAQPGTLPLLNKEAVKKAILFGLAIDANIAKVTTFDRKSYFYPDSPRNYQITQFFKPIITNGVVKADVEGKSIEVIIKEAHLEDDSGMLKHFSNFAGVDFNRAGVPLLEIVSEPSMKSAKEAKAYAMAIKAIMEYIDASNCNMEEGSLRVDANVSVRFKNEKELRPKVEIKNMNSFSFLEMAIDHEIKRQIHLYDENPNTKHDQVIVSSTYRWDSTLKKTVLMRKKESAQDYRYFPEPDIPPLFISQDMINEIKKELPELPHARFIRYVNSLKLSEYSASILINDKKLCNYFEEALLHTKNANLLCNILTIELTGKLKAINKSVFTLNIPPIFIANIVNLIDEKKINKKIAKSVIDDLIENPKLDPIEIVKNNPNYQPLDDVSEIEPIVDQVLKDNPSSIEDYLNGKDKALAFLVGQVMKQTKGKASPQIVNDLILKKINKD
ncbi:MAG: Aspartyl/glutamyl-tRNA(Asn/Gln) amidotransferase subunit B [Candidatus Anoxychlamydiales bacterium]|nr:Aspartyl/glutamyl-tRNA(Asn/Gln) amidotransferase subunit B [Candidatus Anoxychlamydiales bacterium]